VAESHERFTYQKAAGIHLAAYSAHAREVRLQKGEIGPCAESGISGGAKLGDSGDKDIASPDYLSMRVAKLNQEPRSQGLRSGGRKPVTAAAARR
jgi:hypothetical protein